MNNLELSMSNRAKAHEDVSLFSLTRDLHHACEEHPVGNAMSKGDVNEQWWADWLGVLHAAHSVLDKEIDERFGCVDKLEQDIKASNVSPRECVSALAMVERLKQDKNFLLAAHYVLTGAHLMGGQVMRKTIGERLPTAHLQLGDRKDMLQHWMPMRERVDLADEARDVFKCLLDIMDDIVANDYA